MPNDIEILPPLAITISGKILKVKDWPFADRAAWTSASFAGGDLLDIKLTPSWGVSSRELFARCYGGWLQWLVETGRFKESDTPADRVSKANVGHFLRDRQTLGNKYRTLENYATSLRHVMRVLAPSLSWEWLLPCIEKMKDAQPKKKAMSGLPSIQDLFELGLALMETADKNPIGTIRDRAFMFRNGLAISILAARAFMRRKNLASIVIGKNLIRDQSGFVLQFGKDEMKQKREASMFLPNMLTPMIDRYIDYYRPGILNGKADPGGALWVSHFHEMIEPKGLANEIVKLTSAAFGKRISPHKFRHCAATSIANLDSKNILMVPTILFHSNFKISEKFYIFADSQAAFFAHDKALSRLASVSSAP